MNDEFKPIITLFHCVNALDDGESLVPGGGIRELRTVKMACSSMTKDVYLLRAFEAGADAVVVLACPEGECRHVDGNIRAGKRVERVKRLLDEIGLSGGRLSFHNVPAGSTGAVSGAIKQAVADVKSLGPNPAA